MATFSIENFGCRATEADAAVLRHGLLTSGLLLAHDHSSADLIVLNTCTVTAAADCQTREAARIIVTGCYAQRAPEEVAALEGVSWVIGNSHQTEIPRVAAGLVGRSSHEISRVAQVEPKDFVP